jgi:hypothetical protein
MALASAAAQTQSHAQFPPLLYAAEGAKAILEYDSTGKVIWSYPAEMSRDAWRLPNGNTLFSYNLEYDSKKNDNPSGVREVTRAKKIVFDFHTTGQVWCCQRLPDGNTLVGAASQGKLLIVAPDGRIVREIRLLSKGGHACLRNARQIANGDFLVAEQSGQAVREYGPDGKLLREIKPSFPPYSAVRLANGNTVISGQMGIAEVDPRDKELWRIEEKDLPDIGMRWFAGVQVLPNGNLFVCNAGGMVTFLEIDRNKHIVWQSNHGPSDFPFGHGIQRLDVDGVVIK